MDGSSDDADILARAQATASRRRAAAPAAPPRRTSRGAAVPVAPAKEQGFSSDSDADLLRRAQQKPRQASQVETCCCATRTLFMIPSTQLIGIALGGCAFHCRPNHRRSFQNPNGSPTTHDELHSPTPRRLQPVRQWGGPLHPSGRCQDIAGNKHPHLPRSHAGKATARATGPTSYSSSQSRRPSGPRGLMWFLHGPGVPS